MRLLVATDAWRPQVNGVVRTYERLDEETAKLGVDMALLTPAEFNSFPCPTYPEIRLAVPGYSYVIERIGCIQPDAVHIATEGPLGWMTRAYCLSRNIPFTTSFHTRFPEYLQARTGVPTWMSYTVMRRFHNAGAGVMVASRSLADELAGRGFRTILPWTRGVDTTQFKPRNVRLFGSDEPVYIYVGRVAVEKNLDAFLGMKVAGKKVIVGTGPQLDELKARYPQAIFTGKKVGEELADCYASADVFVFPSRTDTFGIVLIEAMASGLPVAAYPVTGPIDNVVNGVTGVLDEDLATAAVACLGLDRAAVIAHAQSFNWETAARQFVTNIETALFARQGRLVPKRRFRLRRARGPANA